MQRPFSQIDVFSATPLRGNPVAVVHDADGLSDEQLAAFARWTNLSETTFLLPPTRREAHYRLRIFTPAGELPFAGHPTLGSARAWLEANADVARMDSTSADQAEHTVIQECAIGLVDVTVTGERLAFAAPPLTRSGPLEPDLLARIERALGVEGEIQAHSWVANGPNWAAIMLNSADRLLGLTPDLTLLRDVHLGVVAPLAEGPADFEVRAFVPDLGIGEDPVTGSLNAGLALWLPKAGLAPPQYTVRQGTALGRDGRVFISTDDDGRVWAGGETRVVIQGHVDLG